MASKNRKRKVMILLICFLNSLFISSNQFLEAQIVSQDSTLLKIPSIEKSILDINIPVIDPNRPPEPPLNEFDQNEKPDQEWIYVLDDSTCVFPLIKPNNEYYLIGAFYGKDPIICIDNGSLVGAITFDSRKSDILKRKSPKSICELIEKGWYLCCPGYELLIRNLDDYRELKFLWPFYLYKKGDIVANELYKNNDRWTIGGYEEESLAYLLILIRTDKINEIFTFNEKDNPITLNSSTAYYPMIIPLYDSWQKLEPNL